LSESANKKRLLILNKVDLAQKLVLPAGLSETVIEVSCLTGQGVEALKDAIQQLAWSGKLPAEALETMINSRHQDALVRSRDATERASAALASGQNLELVAVDLRTAVNAIGEIVGKTTTEDLLDSIFSQFCIGK
jgi:tRNA modification GTPase